MEKHSEGFVGIDVAKHRNAIAVAPDGRDQEVRFLGEVEATPEAMRKVAKRLAAKFERLHFCYEAGPTGYGLHRQLTALGYACTVVAPSLIPRRPGDRVKTNRRDAVSLARLLRAGELTAVWVPDASHEAIRDLVRGRAAAVENATIQKQQIGAFMLRHGRQSPYKKAWGARYMRWLHQQSFEHAAQQIVLSEMLEALRAAQERVERLNSAIAEMLPNWSLAPIVHALMALRGVEINVATTFVSEVGDLRRFANARQLMGYLGLVPSESSTGDTVKRGPITKAGNRRVRHMLVESAWTYRHPPRVGPSKLARLEAVPEKIRKMAWKAQSRLTARYRALSKNGKKTTVINVAVARELAGFMWSIGREAMPT
jgi:transposase